MKRICSILLQRIDRFRVACRGIGLLFRTQINAWIHLAATIAVVSAAFFYSVTETEWLLLLLTIGLVWTAEAINTAIEFTVDLASPEYHELAGKAKDTAAGAVLLACFAAVCIGVVVFGPRIFS